MALEQTTQSQESCAGCWTDWKLLDEVHAQQIADKVRKEAEQSLGRDFSMYKVVKYRSQLVAGMNYEMKVMVTKLQIKALFDIDGTVTVNEFNINPLYSVEPYQVPQLLGGWSEVNPATQEVQEVADKCRAEIEAGLKRKFSVFSAVSYQQQIVRGSNFNITVMVGECDEKVFVDLQQKVTLNEFSVQE